MFPTTPILTDFHRPNTQNATPEWDTLGHQGGFANMGIASHQGVDSFSATKFAWPYWTLTEFGPDSEAYIILGTYGSEPNIRVGARFTDELGLAPGYLVNVSLAGAWSLIRENNFGANVLVTTANIQALSDGDGIGIQIVGTVIMGFWMDAATGLWQQMVSYDVQGDAIQLLTAGSVLTEFRFSTLAMFGGGTYQPGEPGPNVGRSLAGRFA